MVCDSYVRPATLVRLCDECNYGSLAGRCTICGGVGVSDAFYCKECTVQEKDVSLLMPQSACNRCLQPCVTLQATYTILHTCGTKLDILLVCCSGMAVQRSSTWAPQERISSMRGRGTSAAARVHALLSPL